MSHYTKVTTKITRKSALVKALIAMGFKSHQIECLEKPEKLKGYHGDYRQQMADVRIKGSGWGYSQNYVGGASNDLGFERLEDGSYAFHVSDYDQSRYGKSWQDKLLQNYGKAVVHEVAGECNYFIESEEEVNGEITIRLSSPF